MSRASLAAKGALIEIMCLAFECEKRGVLKTGGVPWTVDEIAFAMGGDKDINITAIEELLALKVLKKDRKNAIFQQRMCKDENLRRIRQAAGSKGGNPNLVNQKRKQKPTPSSSSSSSSSKIHKEIQSVSAKKFSLELSLELPANVLEAAEMNQHTLTGKKQTMFIRSQWKVFLHERLNDPPEKQREYRRVSDLTRYFLNWIRNKQPKPFENNETSHTKISLREQEGREIIGLT